MKTLTTLTLATLLTASALVPVNANPLTDALTELANKQISELSSDIKQQAKQTLESTVAELFFNSGSQQAEQAVQKSGAVVSDGSSEATQLQQ